MLWDISNGLIIQYGYGARGIKILPIAYKTRYSVLCQNVGTNSNRTLTVVKWVLDLISIVDQSLGQFTFRTMDYEVLNLMHFMTIGY